MVAPSIGKTKSAITVLLRLHVNGLYVQVPPRLCSSVRSVQRSAIEETIILDCDLNCVALGPGYVHGRVAWKHHFGGSALFCAWCYYNLKRLLPNMLNMVNMVNSTSTFFSNSANGDSYYLLKCPYQA
ncbi:hypothetical protein CDAR_280301 [Caerostris darwini]|uniref:Uncharacterized protein n=1 Tax=Caerostris darwini TaxID=1538125 RepID=A0AAV4WHC4_9ARAC|nr:hypothetical protein CDAR_280301 [Caerostris darwini]